TIIQPLIAPLYGGKSAHELLAAFTEEGQRSGLAIVRDYWQKQRGTGDFERFWRQALQEGVVPESRLAPKAVTLQEDWHGRSRLPGGTGPARQAGHTLDIVFQPDPTIFDGRFANNGWLQELPKPVTKLTWDNAAFLSPKTAKEYGL